MTKSFVTIADLSKEKIMSLLEAAARFEANPNRKTLDGKVIATLFFEPSSSTAFGVHHKNSFIVLTKREI